jgi:hypothetical protein
MKYLQPLLLLMLLSPNLQAQSNPLAAFENLINRTWSAEGQWSDGSTFKQEVYYEYSLDQKIVLAKSKGFIDEQQTEFGPRNHGIRKYDEKSKTLRFWEFDAFGGLTEGTVQVDGKNILYQYEYEDALITDFWEYIDEDTYHFKVGNYEDGSWKKLYLETQFKAPSMVSLTQGQEELPFRQIPDYPDKYTAATVAARLVDGLGFRYYWATEGLRRQDLDFQPNPQARKMEETIDHIYGLVNTLVNAVNERPNTGVNLDGLSFAEKRKQTLLHLKEASDILRSSKSKKLKDFKLIFQRGDQKTEYPFWNEINGPIADALWHVGQVVSFRRSSGNPLPRGVNVLTGTKR